MNIMPGKYFKMRLGWLYDVVIKRRYSKRTYGHWSIRSQRIHDSWFLYIRVFTQNTRNM